MAEVARGSGQESRVILHLDADCFYAQVEAKRLGIGPDLPLAVQQWGGLIAVNYPARARGVSRFMTADDAKKHCPDIHLVHVELIGEKGEDTVKQAQSRSNDKVTLQRYRVASAEIFAVLQRFGTVEKASVDEAYLDITPDAMDIIHQADEGGGDGGDEEERSSRLCPSSSGSNVYGALDLMMEGDCLLAAGAKVCARVRAAVKSETGYTLSAGVSHNKMLAKLASAQNKPDKQTIVPASGIESLMRTLPLRSIRGLGGKFGAEVVKGLMAEPAMAGKDEAGLLACDLHALGEGDLARMFGERSGGWLHRVCRGLDDEEVKEGSSSKSMLAFKSFAAVAQPGEAVNRWLRVLSSEVAERIVREREDHSRVPHTLTLHFRGRAGQGSRSAPIASAVLVDGASEDQVSAVLLQQGSALLAKAGAEAFPCTRLALGAGNFKAIATGSGSISHFFAPRQGANASEVGEGDAAHVSGSAHEASPDVRRAACGAAGHAVGSIESMFAKQDGGSEGREERWEEGMAMLESMGFERGDAARRALASARGEVAGAVQVLLGEADSGLGPGEQRGSRPACPLGRKGAAGGKAVGGQKRGTPQGSMDIASMFAKQARR